MAVPHRAVKLFRNGRNQAVRIPVEFELPGSEAVMYREGDRIIIQPARTGGLAALLASWTPLPDSLIEVDDPPPQAEEVF